MSKVEANQPESASSDAELISCARTGSSEAFGELYARHAAAALTVARQYVSRPADAEDVVADAFAKVMTILRSGKGPDVAFRAYLFTVVRRQAYDVAKGSRRAAPTDDMSMFEDAFGPMASTEEPTLAGFERSTVARAFEGLPERWRAVLWYAEVENMAPAQIAPMLGLTANGVSALAYRAREGLRQAYLQQHLSSTVSDDCRRTNALLGSYVRGGLARRETVVVEAHLESCGECGALVLELGDVSQGMRGVVGPLVLGLGAIGLMGVPLPVGGSIAGAVLAGGLSGGSGVVGAAGGAAGAAGTGAGVAGAGAGAAGTGAAAGAAAGAAGAAGGSAAAVGGAAAGGAAASGAAVAGAGAAAAGAGLGAGAVAGGTFAATGVAGLAALGGAGAAAGATGIASLVGSAPMAVAAVALGAVAVAGIGIAVTTFTGTGVPVATSSEGPAALPDGNAPDAVSPDGPAGDGDLPDALDPMSPGNIPADPLPAQPLPSEQPLADAAPLADTPFTDPGGTAALPPSDAQPLPAPDTSGTVPDGADPAPDTDPGTGGGTEPETDPGTDTPPDPGTDTPPAPAPAQITLSIDGTLQLAARKTEPLVVSASNVGGTSADDVTVAVVLPPGVESPDGATMVARGASVPRVLSAEQISCGRPDSSDIGVERTVQCTVGTLAPGESKRVSVPVRAQSGGTYAFGAKASGADLPEVARQFDPTSVAYYGAELRTRAGDVQDVANPGTATLPVTVSNTGDLGAQDLQVEVSLPDGVTYAAAPAGWQCSGTTDVTCLPDAARTDLPAGKDTALPLQVFTDGALDGGTEQAAVRATAADRGEKPLEAAASAALDVDEPWSGLAGATVEPVCSADATTVATAEALVVLDATNDIPTDVRVTLSGTGLSTDGTAVVPAGAARTVTVDDGLGYDAGDARVALSTTLEAGPSSDPVTRTVERTYDAGAFPRCDAFTPQVEAPVVDATDEADGTVGLDGTFVNKTRADLEVAMTGSGEDPVVVPAGEGRRFDYDTEQKSYEGQPAFSYRWVENTGHADEDRGGQHTITTSDVVKAAIEPKVSLEEGQCTWVPDSRKAAVTLVLDNTRSTFPTTFSFTNKKLDPVTVEAGGSARLTIPIGLTAESIEIDAHGDVTSTTITRDMVQRCDWRVESADGPNQPMVVPQCVDGRIAYVGSLRNVSDLGMDTRMFMALPGASYVQSGTAARLYPAADAQGRPSTGTFTIPTDLVKSDSRSVSFRLNRTGFGGGGLDLKVVVGAWDCTPVPAAAFTPGTSSFDADTSRSVMAGAVTLGNKSAPGVAITYEVTGPGLDQPVRRTVAAAESATVDVRVPTTGRSFTVTAGDWSQTVEAAPFTARCLPEWKASTWRTVLTYPSGAAVSDDGANYVSRWKTYGVGSPSDLWRALQGWKFSPWTRAEACTGAAGGALDAQRSAPATDAPPSSADPAPTTGSPSPAPDKAAGDAPTGAKSSDDKDPGDKGSADKTPGDKAPGDEASGDKASGSDGPDQGAGKDASSGTGGSAGTPTPSGKDSPSGGSGSSGKGGSSDKAGSDTATPPAKSAETPSAAPDAKPAPKPDDKPTATPTPTPSGDDRGSRHDPTADLRDWLRGWIG
ncbi:sigma-70 family RNA polymerase sigma factor [Cellulomonas sp. PhB143]|uniref:sigma-70 family RNA polymerase sigma factor n=1 Tax=Cellulomonas sp. PhB143 TaxID=2485186 RepID=UPI000F494477|nr:sigma-70 family RNA polymerase sigma factor [Cellulomonas sp. PhB143]ROS72076.1 RNA polymerase sigma factor (sigma-70 family) [Cellulomonas sp. PhB143]